MYVLRVARKSVESVILDFRRIYRFRNDVVLVVQTQIDRTLIVHLLSHGLC
jgi:hypothetical protein